MAFTNYQTKEIFCKIIYLGPRLSGKTENLKSIFRLCSDGFERQQYELKNPKVSDFFDFLPVSLGRFKGFHLKLHIFGVNPTRFYPIFEKILLRGVDGVVFVLDARLEALVQNIEAIDDTRTMFAEADLNFSNLPKIVQYNKMDMAEAEAVAVLRSELNPENIEVFEAVAALSIGTVETLDAISKKVLKELCQ